MPFPKERCVVLSRPKQGVGREGFIDNFSTLKEARDYAKEAASKNASCYFEVYQLAAVFASEVSFTVKEL